MTVAPARALALAIEPFAGQVYFSPECHQSYAALGFGPSPAKTGEVEMPDGPAYFCSRGSVMGQVPGEVIAAAFAVFNPAVVVPAVANGWTLTDASTICAARTDGAVRQLRRILGAHPDGLDRVLELLQRATDRLPLAGKPLFAGLVALGLPGEALADAWRLADELREYRGDVHVNVWTSAGFDGVEIGLITELYWGMPLRSYIRTRAWTDEDLAAAEKRLESRGLVRDGALTDAGRTARETIEVATDEGCMPITAALGDDLDELVGLIGAWSRQLQAAGGYPAAGPQDLAALANR
ncbi:SCO6745 family protein [Mycobacterium sp.]|uniref:SCO6745 family protein n=1 Tax=Mycobacterium sp. TaxID=1785 RepID=UPI003D6B7DDE